MNLEDINNFISENLHELAWHKDYPLVEEAGLWSWINGMQESGFILDLRQDPIRIGDTLELPRERWELSTKISKEEILRGWGHNPRASPKALCNSMYLVIDRLQEHIKEKFQKWKVPRELSNALERDRTDKAHKALELMENHFLKYFQEYHEGVFSFLGSYNSQLHRPRILNDLLRRDIINLDRINGAVAHTQFEGILHTNIEDTIAVLKESEPIEDGGYVTDNEGGVFGYRGVSQSGVEDYIWGSFLLELAKAKGYPLREYGGEDYGRFGMLEIAFDLGWNVLDNAAIMR